MSNKHRFTGLKTNNNGCIEQSINDVFKKQKVYPSSIFVCSLFYEFIVKIYLDN